jgi:hypothetical protein
MKLLLLKKQYWKKASSKKQSKCYLKRFEIAGYESALQFFLQTESPHKTMILCGLLNYRSCFNNIKKFRIHKRVNTKEN